MKYRIRLNFSAVACRCQHLPLFVKFPKIQKGLKIIDVNVGPLEQVVTFQNGNQIGANDFEEGRSWIGDAL